MRFLKKILQVLIAMLVATTSLQVLARTAAEIDNGVSTGLQSLYASTPVAKKLAKSAKGILVFPDVLKAGFVVGGQYGEGALLKNGKTAGYYSTLAASYGFQAGAQTFGYALFFMTDSSLEYLNKSEGWEVGVGPTVVLVDEGVSKSLTTTTTQDDIYAVFFNQEGLMLGLGVQGSKIERLTPKK